MQERKEIIYPIFLEASIFAKEEFWRLVFEDLSYGKCPYGTYISKDFLCCGYKDKEFAYKIIKVNPTTGSIEKRDPEILYNDVYNLLTKKLGLMSHKQQANNRMAFEEMKERISDNRIEWNSIKKKSVKSFLIERFVLDVKNKWNFTIQKTKFLLSLIMMAMVLGAITSSDIDYRDGKIHSIDGLQFTEDEIKLDREIYKPFTGFSPQSSSTKIGVEEIWTKFTDSLIKLKNDPRIQTISV